MDAGLTDISTMAATDFLLKNKPLQKQEFISENSSLCGCSEDRAC
jgi:hypothetical protein